MIPLELSNSIESIVCITEIATERDTEDRYKKIINYAGSHLMQLEYIYIYIYIFDYLLSIEYIDSEKESKI